jgi:hypothetical protein
VNAIQEQQEQIEEQGSELAAMEARLNALEGGGAGGSLKTGGLWIGGLLLGAVALVIVKRPGGKR